MFYQVISFNLNLFNWSTTTVIACEGFNEDPTLKGKQLLIVGECFEELCCCYAFAKANPYTNTILKVRVA